MVKSGCRFQAISFHNNLFGALLFRIQRHSGSPSASLWSMDHPSGKISGTPEHVPLSWTVRWTVRGPALLHNDRLGTWESGNWIKLDEEQHRLLCDALDFVHAKCLAVCVTLLLCGWFEFSMLISLIQTELCSERSKKSYRENRNICLNMFKQYSGENSTGNRKGQIGKGNGVSFLAGCKWTLPPQMLRSRKSTRQDDCAPCPIHTLVAPGIATRSKDATSSSWSYY